MATTLKEGLVVGMRSMPGNPYDGHIDHGALLTMSNQFKKAIVDDVASRHIDASLQDNLLDLFESAMKSVAMTLVREAKFDTTDFATAKMRGCRFCNTGRCELISATSCCTSSASLVMNLLPVTCLQSSFF